MLVPVPIGFPEVIAIARKIRLLNVPDREMGVETLFSSATVQELRPTPFTEVPLPAGATSDVLRCTAEKIVFGGALVILDTGKLGMSATVRLLSGS